MTDIDKLAREIADRIVKDCDGIENAWDEMNDQERDFFKQFITAGMKLQRERDAEIVREFIQQAEFASVLEELRNVHEAIAGSAL